jgi:hypothetical protein
MTMEYEFANFDNPDESSDGDEVIEPRNYQVRRETIVYNNLTDFRQRYRFTPRQG